MLLSLLIHCSINESTFCGNHTGLYDIIQRVIDVWKSYILVLGKLIHKYLTQSLPAVYAHFKLRNPNLCAGYFFLTGLKPSTCICNYHLNAILFLIQNRTSSFCRIISMLNKWICKIRICNNFSFTV